MATALPPSTDFTGSAVTEGGFKTAITSQRDFLAGLLGADGTILTAHQTMMLPYNGSNAKSAAYTVAAADRGKVIYATGAGGWTLTLPTTITADFGVGFFVGLKNMTTGTITIARSGSDTIDGAASISIEAGASAQLFIAATAAWVSMGASASANGELRAIRYYGGTTTWTKLAGLKRIRVICIGGGGGAGGALNSGCTSGGGGGGYAENFFDQSSVGASVTVTIGGGGSGGSLAVNGGTGGTSSFGGLIYATGGGGSPYSSSTPNYTPGAGGSGAGGLVMAGETGGMVHVATADNFIVTGKGGSSLKGFGGASVRSAGLTTANGTNGSAYGGGGSGCRGAANATGGSGAQGIVIVEEYY